MQKKFKLVVITVMGMQWSMAGSLCSSTTVVLTILALAVSKLEYSKEMRRRESIFSETYRM